MVSPPGEGMRKVGVWSATGSRACRRRRQAADTNNSRTHTYGSPPSGFPVCLGARTFGPALALQLLTATQPGHHPGHPTAVGGLPASKPGLDADTHDRPAAYRNALRPCQSVARGVCPFCGVGTWWTPGRKPKLLVSNESCPFDAVAVLVVWPRIQEQRITTSDNE